MEFLNLKNEAIKRGKECEKDGLGFNKYYAEHRLNEGARIFYRTFENGKHKYQEVTLKTIESFPINDEMGYLSSQYMTIEIVSDICSNTRMAGAIINAEKN